MKNEFVKKSCYDFFFFLFQLMQKSARKEFFMSAPCTQKISLKENSESHILKNMSMKCKWVKYFIVMKFPWEDRLIVGKI